MRDRVRRAKRKKRRALLIIVSILLCAIIAGGIYAYAELNKVKTANLPKDDVSLGIDSTVSEILKEKDVINIALFGVDRRNPNEGSRSDSIMILSIDKEHNKIKVTSLMRDLYVAIDGHGMDKITHAYAYGKAPLSIKTINSNFKLNIKDYVTVDFFSLEKIIDALGGIEVDIKKEEISYEPGYGFNFYIKEVSDIEKKTPQYITKTGLQKLNGLQAVAYARIRNTSGSDYARTERQRLVLDLVIKKATKAGVSKYPALLNSVLPYVETSLSKTDILGLGTTVVTNGITKTEQFRIPEDGVGEGKMINGVYYLVADLPTTTKHIYKFIYEEEMK